MNDLLAALIVAVTGLPALGIAAWSSRGLRWALIALSLFLGAIGLYLAAGNRMATYAMVIALVVVVNALGVALVLHLRRAPVGTGRR